MFSGENLVIKKIRNPLAILICIGIFFPRLILSETFFIQDEQPWMNRSQLYSSALFSGDFHAAVQFPLSTHPAIPLMTTIGPAMNAYGAYFDLDGTYGDWSLDHKRDAAILARVVWGVVCSIALVFLYGVIKNMSLFKDHAWAAGLVVVLLGLEPWIWGISRSVSVDVLMAIGVVGMLVSAVNALNTKQQKWVVYSGMWFGLAFVSKSPALISAPFAFLIACYMRRPLAWILGVLGACVFLWPPFLLHPIARITDVLSRAELHATVQESYLWEGYHPPLFIFTLSSFATIGCLLYIWNRIQDIRMNGSLFFTPDIVFVAGIWHGLVLLYLNGDHARKNLPVLAILGFMGALGWVWFLLRSGTSKSMTVVGLLLLQGVFVWPYFPHVISSYNTFFPSVAGKRLLVDVGNSSRLVAEYINSHDQSETYSIPMDSLIMPYINSQMRSRIRGLPANGELKNLEPEVTTIIVPASLPARINFDADAKKLVTELSSYRAKDILAIRDVPMFYVYTYDHESGI